MATPSARIRAVLTACIAAVTLACDPFALEPIPNAIEFSPRLSDYSLFRGPMSSLIPNDDVFEYQLNTSLFTDYAVKQRLLRLPGGSAMVSTGEGLPNFPDGTLLAKTFSYPRDVRNPSLGRHIVETRLLMKHEGRWNAATYLWNTRQDDAQLIADGRPVAVEWITNSGTRRAIRYEVPSTASCSSCHRSDNQIQPIGPQLRNLQNSWPDHAPDQTGQLPRLVERGMLVAQSIASVRPLPNWEDTREAIADRARAYMDVNCAHCHRPTGWASASGLLLEFERPFSQTRISSRRDRMMQRLTAANRTERMPRIGTTIPHDEAIAVMAEYLGSLRR